MRFSEEESEHTFFEKSSLNSKEILNFERVEEPFHCDESVILPKRPGFKTKFSNYVQRDEAAIALRKALRPFHQVSDSEMAACLFTIALSEVSFAFSFVYWTPFLDSIIDDYTIFTAGLVYSINPILTFLLVPIIEDAIFSFDQDLMDRRKGFLTFLQVIQLLGYLFFWKATHVLQKSEEESNHGTMIVGMLGFILIDIGATFSAVINHFH